MAEENINGAVPPADMNFPQPGDMPGGNLSAQVVNNDNSISPNQMRMPEPVRPLSRREEAIARQSYQKQIDASPTISTTYPELPQPDVGFESLEQTLPSRDNVLNLLDQRFNTMDQRVNQDAFAFGKGTMFNSNDPSNMGQFKERYQEHGSFDELGFSPFRDNEALYNSNSSWTSDLMRAGGQWAELTGLAAIDMVRFGDQSDSAIAKQQEDLFAIGSSTRGGVGGFATNFFLNSGTTVGILAELAVETIAIAAAEAALGISTVASGGTAAPVTTPLMTGGFLRLANTVRKGYKGITRGFKMAKNLGKTLDNMKDFSRFKNFMAKGGKFVNPVDNTFDFFKTLKAGSDYSNFSKGQKVLKGISAGYMDVRNARLTWAEAAMEGGGVTNGVADQLLEQWEINNPGKTLSEKEARDMLAVANSAGSEAAWYNTPAIFFTNKLMFNGLVSGKFQGIGQKLITADGKKLIFDGAKKSLGSNYTLAARRWGTRQWNKVLNPKQTLKDSLKGGVLYGEANVGEGLQEITQETIAGAAEEMAMLKYDEGNLTRGGLYNFIGSGLEKQISAQGVETFLSGFLMGGMISPISGAISNMTNKSSPGAMETGIQYAVRKGGDVFQRTRAIIGGSESAGAEAVVKRRAERERLDKKYQEEGQKDVDNLNQYFEDPVKYLSPHVDNLEFQKETAKAMEDAEQAGNHKGKKDASEASTRNHILTSIRYNTTDTIIERLREMEKIPDDQWDADFKGITKEEYIKKVDKFVDRAKELKNDYEGAVKVLGSNPYNLASLPEDQRDPIAFKAMQIGRIAWDNAMQDLVFKKSEMRDALNRKESILYNAKNNIGLKNTPYGDYNLIFAADTIENEILLLNTELKDFGEPQDKQSKEYVKGRENKLTKLKALQDAISSMNRDASETEQLSPEVFNTVSKAYEEYVLEIAGQNKDYVSKADIQKGTTDFIDNYLLEARSRRDMSQLDLLLNPNGFVDLVDRIRFNQQERYENKKLEIEASLALFKKQKYKNEMLNKLFEAGMFFKVEDLAAFDNEGIVPKNIYYTTAQKDGTFVVERRSDDFGKAMKILQEYSDKTLTGIPIAERDDSYADGYASTVRQRDPNDKRTYEDLAKQYGFDPLKEQTKVNLPTVLQAVIDSKYSSPDEKILAKAMLQEGVANELETVTFRRGLDKVGYYSNEEQSVIDPRYFSSNFDGGGNGVIEQVIMHEEMHRRTLLGLSEDVSFKESIDALHKSSIESWNALSDEQKKELTVSGEPFYGLQNTKEFVAEIFSNRAFQEWLSTIPSNVENKNSKSTWAAFVDYVLDRVKELFGAKTTNSILNAALDATTTYLDTSLGLNVASSSTTTAIQDSISTAITLDEYNNWVKTKKLKKRHIASLAIKEQNNEELNEYEKSIIQDPTASVLVAEYQAMMSSKKPIKDTSKVKDVQDVKELKALGFSKAEIDRMSPKIARQFANEALTKNERNKLRAPERSDLDRQKAEEYKDSVDELFSNITNYNEWQNAEDNFELLLTSYPLHIRQLSGVTSEYVENLKTRELEKLQNETNFDSIKVGEFVLMNNKKGEPVIIEIVGKTSKQLKYKFRNSDKVLKMNASTVPKVILMRYIEGMPAPVEETITPTEEEKNMIKETTENANKAKSKAGAAKKYVESEKTIEELRQEIIKKICK